MMATSKQPSAKGNPALVVLERYTPPKGGKTPALIAHFLDFAAKMSPGTVFTLPQITKAIREFKSVPNANTSEVKLIQNSMTRAKVLLKTTYRRGTAYVKGVGYRAAVDSNDTTNTELRQRASRLVGAKRGIDEVIEIIDASKLNAKEKAFFSDVTKVSNMIGENEIAKLLPPKLPPKLNGKKN